MLFVDRTGATSVLSSDPVTSPVVSPGHDQVAWASPGEDRTRLVLADPASGEVLDEAEYDSTVVPVGFARGTVVLEQQGEGRSALIWIPSRGVTAIPDTVGATATHAESGLAAVTTGQNEDPSTGAPRTCSAVIDAAADYAEQWSSCEFRPMSFSPNGEYVFAHEASTEGLGARRVFLLDASTGEPLRELRVENTTQRIAWESGGTVVIDAWVDGEMALVRCGPDGPCELATTPREHREPTERPWPYLLAQRH